MVCKQIVCISGTNILIIQHFFVPLHGTREKAVKDLLQLPQDNFLKAVQHAMDLPGKKYRCLLTETGAGMIAVAAGIMVAPGIKNI